MAKRPYRISTHEPVVNRKIAMFGCTASVGCAEDAYAVTRRGRPWVGYATCERHAGRRLWKAILANRDAA